ncbi:MAG: regulatory protein RecX, partial [Ornithinimicrobium sp.]
SQKLSERGCEPHDIATVLDQLTRSGLVDDAAFAEVLVRTKRRSSGLAARGLRHELRKKGVPEHVAEAAIADVDPHDERARAEALVAARLDRMRGLDKEVQMRILGVYLARNGYSASLSYAVIREAIDQAPEHARD